MSCVRRRHGLQRKALAPLIQGWITNSFIGLVEQTPKTPMNLQITAEGAAASSSKGMLSGSGPADIQIGQAAPGAALEDEASQGAGGRIHEASLSEVDPHFDHNPTWLTPPEPRKADDGWSVVGEAWRKMGTDRLGSPS